MAVCDNCSRTARKSVEVFTLKERLHILSACVAMLRSIQAGRNEPEDLIISNSIITKMLLSLHEEGRDTILRHFRQTLNMDIKLSSCPHGLSVVS